MASRANSGTSAAGRRPSPGRRRRSPSRCRGRWEPSAGSGTGRRSRRCRAATTQPALQQDAWRKPLLQQPRLQAVADGGAYPRPSCSIVSAVTPRSASCWRARAPAGPASCSRNYAAATSCTFSSVSRSAASAALVRVALGELGQRHAEPLRQHPDRVREADLLVQLEELEHVAADAAAEAVEEPLVGVHVERRRLLRRETGRVPCTSRRPSSAARTPARPARCWPAAAGRR